MLNPSCPLRRPFPSLNASWSKTVALFGLEEARRIMAYELHCCEDLQEWIRSSGLSERVRYAPFRDSAFVLYKTKVRVLHKHRAPL